MKKILKILVKGCAFMLLGIALLIALLIGGYFINECYWEFLSPAAKIKKYIKTNNIEKLKKIKLDKGINGYYNRFTPLFYAVEASNIEAVKYFIEQGADPSMPSGNSCSSGNFRIDAPSCNAIYEPLLYRALINGNNDIAKILIANGANVNERFGGFSILELAIYRKNTDIVKALLAAGANVNAKNNHVETPLEIARENGNKEIVELLIANGAKE